MAIKPIEILIRAKDGASSVLGGLQTKATAVASAIAAAFGISLFVSSVRGAADLEEAMSRVEAAVGGSAEEMAALKKAAEDAGASTKYTSVEAADALENLGKAGLTAAQAIEALPAVLELAQAGGIGLGQASEYITKAVMGMGLAFADAGRVADVLAKGANASNTSVEGLAQALSYAAPVAHSLGLSLETTVAIIGKFADAGIDASRAGTALNSILSQFSDPSSKFREELGAAGIVTNDFEQALRELANAGPAGSKAIISVGQEAGPALRALLGQGIGALDDLKTKLLDAKGSAAETAEVMQNNLKGSFNGLSSAWDAVKNTLGTPVLPVIKEAVDQLVGSLRDAVSSGTVGKFGEAIATGFQSAIKWAQEFLAQFDAQAIAASLQDFADRADESLRQVGEAAANAGNIVQTAWGTMAAGTNVVVAAIYGIGVAGTEAAAFVVKGAALATEALAKIAFGDTKKRLISEAEEIRTVLAGLEGVSDEFGQRSADAMARAAEGAQMARDGFAGLTGEVQAAATASAAAAPPIEAVAEAIEKQGKASSDAAKAVLAKKEADAAAAAAVRQLQAEYSSLVASGSIQAAAEKLVALEKAQRALADTSQATAGKTEAAYNQMATAIDAKSKALQAGFTLEQAGVRLAIEQQKAIMEVARARGDEQTAIAAQQSMRRLEIELLELTATAKREEAKAQLAVIDAQRAAAVASGALTEVKRLELDAAMASAQVKLKEAEITDALASKQRDLNAVLGATGGAFEKATGSAEKLGKGLDGLVDRWHAVGQAAGLSGEQAVSALERQNAAQERLNSTMEKAAELSRMRAGVDKDGFATGKDGNRLVMGSDLGTRTGIAAFLKSAGVDDDAKAREIANEFADHNGDIPYFNNGAQIRYGGRSSTMSEAVLKAAEQYTFGKKGDAPQTPASIPAPEKTITVNINQPGKAAERVRVADQASADALLRLLGDAGKRT